MELIETLELTLAFLNAALIAGSGVLLLMTLQFKQFHMGLLLVALSIIFICSCFKHFKLISNYFKVVEYKAGKAFISWWTAGIVFENHGFGLGLSISLYIFGILYFVLYYFKRRREPKIAPSNPSNP